MKSIVLFMLCVVLIDAEHKDRFRRYVRGSDAESAQFPYFVSVRYPFRYKHLCGGSIVHEEYVLTAAHCIGNNRIDWMTIVAGSTELTDTNHIYFIEKVINHPNYRSKSKFDDIALIKTKTKFEFSDSIQPIPLSRDFTYFEGMSMTICGFGRRSTFQIPRGTLQYSNVTAISLQKCKNNLRFETVTENFICTYDVRKGICMGDSGSPLVYRGEQVAMASWILGLCASGYPDVYTKVTPYIEWLDRYLITEKKGVHVEDEYSVVLIP